ncbi:uncharacterized protein MICPUCDRAFT_945, partial [Micromonas pusilla CCMP1545]
MVPEVLLALLGVPGEVIVLVPGSELHGPERFRVSPDLPFLEPPERASLDRLVSLGYAFRCLERFVADEGESGVLAAVGGSSRSDGGGSLYRRALAAGVGEVLSSYEAAVLRLEQDVLRGATPALPAALESALSSFALVLPSLRAVLRPVMESDDLRGAALLHHLHAAALAAGAPQLESALRALRSRCYRALYQQLLAWTVHGALVDPFGEFWVRRVDGGGGDGGVGASDDPFDGDDGGEDEWHRGFLVSLENLPPGIELPAAEATLFIGRAVRVLSSPRGAFAGKSLLPAEVAAAATASLRALAKNDGEFDRASFELVLETIRAPIAARLGRLVVANARLLDHLGALRAYFLLGRGDFFQTFFEEAAGLLRAPPRSSTAEADMAAPFAQAALKSSAVNDPLASRFRLRFNPAERGGGDDDVGASAHFQPRRAAAAAAATTTSGGGATARVPSFDGWDGLELDYAVPWPLGLILTKNTIARYNKLFQYLLRLKRAQLALDDAWCRVQADHVFYGEGVRGGSRGRGRGERGGAFEACQRVRHDIAFLVNNWTTYLQVDVIESQFRRAATRIAEAPDDFAEAQRAHRSFLAACTAQSFLDLESVSAIIENIMQLAGALCAEVKGLPPDGSPPSPETMVEVDSIGAKFARQATGLYTILRSNRLANDPKAPYLRLLLLRLNYNDFFFSAA